MQWQVRWYKPTTAPGKATLCIRSNKETSRRTAVYYWSIFDKQGAPDPGIHSANIAAPAGGGWRAQASPVLPANKAIRFSVRLVQANGAGSDTWICLMNFTSNSGPTRACPMP
ncbi:hypothetical protein VV02_24030 [Luteipulveratus mongoliensis]|uniref:Uncharacterized protein n=2 Tax=Luteipulveratus mongoliensis TaxID=571913 RepID=A0A0K1JNQ8_9MICO|nr:hypothetical protein VV02_24030 [Luteipulveratus mongoliensis]